jgi:hypothetical protein
VAKIRSSWRSLLFFDTGAITPFYGGRCDSNEKSHTTATDTPENIFGIKLQIKYVLRKYFLTTAIEWRQTR